MSTHFSSCPDARALLDASQQCTSDREGVLLFTSATHQLKVCSNSQWIAGYKPPPKGSLSNVAYSCGEVAANPENRINGSYYVYVNWIPVQVSHICTCIQYKYTVVLGIQCG